MGALIEVILPVFLVIGAGFIAVKRGLFSDDGADALMKFTQTFAIPCLLFRGIAELELDVYFEPRLLVSYYLSALTGFTLGTFGARLIFGRPWEDSIAIGFCCLFSNAVLLGLPITERAYGEDALSPNYAIIAINAPFCYCVGITVMEVVRNRGSGLWRTSRAVWREITHNALIIGIGLGFVVNLTSLPLPGVLTDALDLMIRAALPAAIFGLGGVLARYKLEGDTGPVIMVCALMLVVQPSLTWLVAGASGIGIDAFRSAVLTSAMAPGVNAYVFANMYGVAKRVAASAVLISTALSILTLWVWLALLP
ncbi:AEC family transporter [Litoreibacter arenae]|uniref:Malonate transporter n=1 Tax=Litoreibacter arenae DSM 19593 TaxID=1123360 RepID=S9S1N9_9RHOB|nr:AEC family transporter [Litoreibacter arenae]EPX80104.1 malonate transporter [Litoreibacter arenae DSM 19593]